MIPNKQLRRIMIKNQYGGWELTKTYAETLQDATVAMKNYGFVFDDIALIIDEYTPVCSSGENSDDI